MFLLFVIVASIILLGSLVVGDNIDIVFSSFDSDKLNRF